MDRARFPGWSSLVFGYVSKFTECTLGQMYRSTDSRATYRVVDHYLYDGLVELKLGGLEGLAVLFALMCIGGSLGGGNMFQSNQAFVAVWDRYRSSPTRPGCSVS